MGIIIDRRLNSKGKSTVNRDRFMRRYRGHIRRAVNESINRRSITDTKNGENISINKKDLSEPYFTHGTGGIQKRVHPGNKEFSTGDRFKRPRTNSQGSNRGTPTDGGISIDNFVFKINRDEFLEYLFDDLELPNMISKSLKKSTDFITKRAGFSNNGSPEKLNIIRSLKNAYARRIAISGKERRELKKLKNILHEHEQLFYEKKTNKEIMPSEEEKKDESNIINVRHIKNRIEVLNKKIRKNPFIDDFDLKFNHYVKVPTPSNKAVMFCIMDVSGSMTRDIKDIAKRFFFLLYLFLQRNYKSVEIVFIRHHAEAKECNEEDFFYARETGGTVVSSALNLTKEIIQKRFISDSWNIYVAQASDGDNWEADSPRCVNIIKEHLIQSLQYFAYVEITDRQHQNLWHEYEIIAKEYNNLFAMSQIRTAANIYPVFRQLFEKKAC